ncbi:hypothetical protein [Streptomyces sp. CRN 30]|uniref:hypothetical protein n=1 Tax=Streptomyces sp. CRN 30 TaxID=3075613 RepID=UPI002A827038|nr:hypothetical protein [Streptomyces sp. CRN 30]
MSLTINMALLLAVVIILLLFRPVQARKRWDQFLVVVLSVILGVLLAPTDFGRSIINGLGQLTQSFS